MRTKLTFTTTLALILAVQYTDLQKSEEINTKENQRISSVCIERKIANYINRENLERQRLNNKETNRQRFIKLQIDAFAKKLQDFRDEDALGKFSEKITKTEKIADRVLGKKCCRYLDQFHDPLDQFHDANLGYFYFKNNNIDDLNNLHSFSEVSKKLRSEDKTTRYYNHNGESLTDRVKHAKLAGWFDISYYEFYLNISKKKSNNLFRFSFYKTFCKTLLDDGRSNYRSKEAVKQVLDQILEEKIKLDEIYLKFRSLLDLYLDLIKNIDESNFHLSPINGQEIEIELDNALTNLAIYYNTVLAHDVIFSRWYEAGSVVNRCDHS